MSDPVKKYAGMGLAIGELTQAKNEAYGDSFEKAGKVLELLYPNGIHPTQYRDALGIVRVVDKLFRIATRKDAFGESPWKDISGYGLLGAVADEAQFSEAWTELIEEESDPEPKWEPRVGETVGLKHSSFTPIVEIAQRDTARFFLRFDDNSSGWYDLDTLKPKGSTP